MRPLAMAPALMTLLVVAALGMARDDAIEVDSRDVNASWGVIFSAGNDTGYSDQPQVVTFNDTHWLCVITCSPG